MRKKWFALFLTGLMAVMSTGCGGEFDGVSGDSAVSGSAVSGTAVSGQAVSGAALEEGTETPVTQKKGMVKYRFCNDSHLYYMEDGFQPIIEYDLSDGSCREIKFGKEDRIAAICYVDDDWVGYLKEIETESYPFRQMELWRAPVENGKLNVQKEEFVFSDELVMEDKQIYCDGRYLLYTTDESLSSYYRKYDLKEKKYIFNATPNLEEDEVDMIVAVTGDTAFISGYDGVFRQDLDSSEQVMITEGIIDQKVAVTETDLFYREELGGDGEEEADIWQYHLADNSKKKIITDEQIRKVLKEEGFLKSLGEKEIEYDPEYLFVSGNRLYMQIGLSWIENKVIMRNKAVLSQEIGDSKELRYEKGLTECLANPEKNRKKFEKIYDDEEEEGEMSLFLSRGTCLYMSGQKCFMYLYDPEKNKNRIACYDLSSGDMKFVTKKDPDWYLPFYEGVQPDWKEIYSDEIGFDMPNNKRVDWPYW